MQELSVSVDGGVHAVPTHHALARALELAVGEQHGGEGGGAENAAVALHLRLLELQQAVAGVGHHVGNGGAEDGQVGAVVGRSLAPGKLDDAPAEVSEREREF